MTDTSGSDGDGPDTGKPPDAPVPSVPASETLDPTWLAPSPLGDRQALISVGTVAAPLLAGFSFTMTALFLGKDHPGRWTNMALALFVGAGFLLIAAVQASVWLQSRWASPGTYREWYPGSFRPDGGPNTSLYALHYTDQAKAAVYASFTRWLYNLGVLLLLGAVAVAVWPVGRPTTGRWVVIGVAGGGFIIELLWVLVAAQSEVRARWAARRKRGGGSVAPGEDAAAEVPTTV